MSLQDDPAAIADFVSITSTDEATAKKFLSSHPNLDAAISACFDQEAEVVNLPVVVVTPPKSAPPPVPNRPHAQAAVVAVASAPKDDWEIVPRFAFLFCAFFFLFFFFFFLFCFCSGPEEPERDIAFLLSKHKEKLAALREGVKDILKEEHDDIFLLRYVLSFELAEGIEAVKWAIAWRAGNFKTKSKNKETQAFFSLRTAQCILADSCRGVFVCSRVVL
jgi:hypothetical protein